MNATNPHAPVAPPGLGLALLLANVVVVSWAGARLGFWEGIAAGLAFFLTTRAVGALLW